MQLRLILIGAATATGLLTAVAALRSAQEVPPAAPVVVVRSGSTPHDGATRPVVRPAAVASVDDPVAPLLAGSSDLERAREDLRGEGRDPAWASASEAQLGRLFRDEAGTAEVRIFCARTRCEATGVLRNDTGRGGPLPPSPVLRRGAIGMGLEPGATGIGQGLNGQRRFVTYFQRSRA